MEVQEKCGLVFFLPPARTNVKTSSDDQSGALLVVSWQDFLMLNKIGDQFQLH